MKVAENELTEDIYFGNKKPLFKIFVISLGLILVGFFLNFPLTTIINQQVSSLLSKNRRCPMSFENLNFSLFLPKITIKKPTISGLCFQKPGAQLKLNTVQLSLTRPSILPPGFRFETTLSDGKSKIPLKPVLGLNKHLLIVENARIDTESFAVFLPNPNMIKGSFDLQTKMEARGQKLSAAEVLMTSKDLLIPGQTIANLNVPRLAINNFQLKSRLLGKSLKIESLVIGDKNSPIQSEIKGSIKLNTISTDRSELDLEGDIRFSPQFLESFAILNLLLNGKKPDENGFYKFKLRGALNSMPRPEFL